MINSNQRNDIWLRSQDLDLWWISWTLPVWLSFRFVVSCRWKWQYTKALTNYVKIILHTDCQVPKTITRTKKNQWVQLVVRIVQTATFQLLWVFSSLVVWQILSVNHLRIIRKTNTNFMFSSRVIDFNHYCFTLSVLMMWRHTVHLLQYVESFTSFYFIVF